MFAHSAPLRHSRAIPEIEWRNVENIREIGKVRHSTESAPEWRNVENANFSGSMADAEEWRGMAQSPLSLLFSTLRHSLDAMPDKIAGNPAFPRVAPLRHSLPPTGGVLNGAVARALHQSTRPEAPSQTQQVTHA